MAISASLVKELREKTGAGMMDCKKALTEVEGDLEKAIEYLKIKGLSKADKKADRVAAEGLVAAFVQEGASQASLVEVNCETDFVARNEEFIAFVNDLAAHVATTGITDQAELLASDLGGRSVEDIRKAKIASIGENISVRRAALLALEGDGVVGEYIHGGGTIGVLVAIRSDRDMKGDEALATLGRDIAMHVAATNPTFLQESEIDEETVASERRVLTEQALESGKPAEIVEKMVEGRIRKWRKEICLVDQPFVKNPDLSVAAEVKRVGGEIGASLELVGFVRFACGEGIEKEESNLADEVAATLR